MKRIIEKGLNGLFLFVLKIVVAIMVICASYIFAQIYLKTLINAITNNAAKINNLEIVN